MRPFNFGPGAVPIRGAGSHLPHSTGSGLQPQSQQQQQHLRHHARLCVAAAGAATFTAGAATVMHLHKHGRLQVPQLFVQQPPVAKPAGSAPGHGFLIPRELAEVMAGAFAEIVQVAVLYPLDTIKVRCQASGLPVRGVVKQLLASPRTAVGQLYAGVVGASIASVAVGSLYFFTFCAAKRAATKMVSEAENNSRAAKEAAAAATAAGGAVLAGSGLAAPALADSSSSSSNSRSGHVSHIFPHGAAADYHYDPVFAAICSDDAAGRAAAAAAHTKSATNTEAASSTATSSAEAAEPSSAGRLKVNVLAACAAALVGALAEAPLELFKHRAQVGQIQGTMLGAMFKALREQGPGALYGSFFLPFCFKSLPFDMGELMTYSTLQDWKKRETTAAPPAVAAADAAGCRAHQAPAAAPHASQEGTAAAAWDLAFEEQQQQQRLLALGSITAAGSLNPNGISSSGSSSSSSDCSSCSSAGTSIQQVLSNTPEHVWDMAVGAAAGAVAVLVSMPPDCIKTVLETGGGVAAKPGSGPLGSIAAFAATGKQLVQQRGVTGGLFMGVAPRLVESVPSTMMYWLAVEGARRVLEPYTAK